MESSEEVWTAAEEEVAEEDAQADAELFFWNNCSLLSHVEAYYKKLHTQVFGFAFVFYNVIIWIFFDFLYSLITSFCSFLIKQVALPKALRIQNKFCSLGCNKTGRSD